jgi:hypothetical protein
MTRRTATAPANGGVSPPTSTRAGLHSAPARVPPEQAP